MLTLVEISFSRVDRGVVVEIPPDSRPGWAAHLPLTKDESSGVRVNQVGAYVRRVSLLRERVPSFARFPFSLDAVRGLTEVQLHQSITFLIGENGCGKSTLLEAIAVAFGLNAEGGSRNFSFSTRASHSELHQYIRLARGLSSPRDSFFFRAESFYNLATEIEHLDSVPALAPPIIDSYGSRSLHEISHGESFLNLLLHRFRANGLYLLDEPEAALSPARQLAALVRIHDLVRAGCQFIIATHSPILMAYPRALILSLSASGIDPIALEETDHFQLTKRFLNNHDDLLRSLLAPD
jgi:predicted ATPase